MPDKSDPMEMVLQIINSDEPDYEKAQELGPEVVAPLSQLIQGKDVLLAMKAVSLASRIKSEKVVDLLKQAAARPEPEIRVAVAGALGNVPGEQIDNLLNQLLDDKDFGVRKFAIAAFAATRIESAKGKVQSIAKSDPEPFLRNVADYALRGEEPPMDLYLMSTDNKADQ
jgi:HEAT repeat protein